MRGARFAVAIALTTGLLTTELAAFEPELPLGARLTAERNSPIDSFEVPLGAFDGVRVPTVMMEGEVRRRAWRVDERDLTPLQLIIPLRQQLERDGYDVTYECEASACGGFDFRFGIEVLPGPNMYVNITRFHALTALRGHAHAPAEALHVLASVTAEAAYVQIIAAKTEFDRGAVLPVTRVLEPPADVDDLVVGDPNPDVLEEHLSRFGGAVLTDLEFATGTSDLGEGPFASLEALAQLLDTQNALRIMLVGHTDMTGDLEANVALSRARAETVRERLISQFGIEPSRLEADGIGFLAPRATNSTVEGRDQNRRVEAVLLGTQ